MPTENEWRSDFKECGPFDHQAEWDKSWVIPIEFKMEDGSVKKTNLVYDSEYDTFDYDKNGDFVDYFDVYSVVAWRFTGPGGAPCNIACAGNPLDLIK